MMNKEQIIEMREDLGNTIAKYHDIIEDESKNIEREYGIDSVNSLKELFKNIENEDRLLQIGIVGRVKAGKSSLLNALFFEGQAILPKAATPMTAALTILSYGETLSAEVDFFTEDDINDIKVNFDKYQNSFEKKVAEIKDEFKKSKNSYSNEEIENKAIRQAKRIMNEQFELSASHDQYERIKQSGINLPSLVNKKNIEAENVSELSQKLLDYVSAEGRYMPFTKSVHIKLPQENLKQIQIVDTPGLDDPVQSREDRTRELLKYCDVIFIVSPSGQFLNSQDINLSQIGH